MRVVTMAVVNHCLELVLLVSWLILHGATQTEAAWIHYNGHEYGEMITLEMNWTDAWAQCMKLKSYLVIINTEDENQFIKNNSDLNKLYWIGLHANPGVLGEHKDKFGWWQKHEGFTDWMDGQPNDSGYVEDCVDIRTTGWNDRNCSEACRYWCERQLADNKSDVGWMYYNGHEYHRFDESKSWIEAWDECRKNDSYLVIINTADENEFIKNNSQEHKLYWIGLHANPGVLGKHENKFGWWQKHDGFTDWIGSNPDNSKGVEDCVEIKTTGWNDNNCSKPCRYWCERQPSGTTAIPTEETTNQLVSVCDSLATLEGALQCLPIGHGDKAQCQAIPGCCFIEVEKFNVSFGMCIKPNGV